MLANKLFYLILMIAQGTGKVRMIISILQIKRNELDSEKLINSLRVAQLLCDRSVLNLDL